MYDWKFLRNLALSLVVASPMCLQSGCGGGAAEEDPAEVTVDPETIDVGEDDDPTLSGEDSTMEETVE